MDAELRSRLADSGYGEPGFAERYDRYRPSPPPALIELLPGLAGVERPQLVVDLGSGTGLSTRLWSERAEQVVGVEPNDAMRAFAERSTAAPNVTYLGSSAYETGLPEACADLVTASQSLHWMRPDAVFPEIGRILRPGGVLCAYAYVSLQTTSWDPEAQWAAVRSRTRELRVARGVAEEVWPVTTERLEGSGIFRHVREVELHHVEEGDGDRLVGFALSEGSLRALLESGVSEEDVGLDRLRESAARMGESRWWIGYRAWLGLK